jgi:hypothetical protein
VGLNGTVVSFPHCEQVVFVSVRWKFDTWPAVSARFALQDLHRLGSFLKPLSAKNICSPAVKTNSAPHSAHFRTLSRYSICSSHDPTLAARPVSIPGDHRAHLDVKVACASREPDGPELLTKP